MSYQPVPYDPDVFERILEGIGNGRTLSDICSDVDMPSRMAVQWWIKKDPECKKRYDLARLLMADTLFDEILDIADGRLDRRRSQRLRDIVDNYDTTDLTRGGKIGAEDYALTLQERKMKIEARVFMIGKLKPKRYGATQHVEISGDPEKPIQNITRIEIVAPAMLPQANPLDGLKVIEHAPLEQAVNSKD